MGIKWTDLSPAQKSMVEGGPVEPAKECAQILRRPRLERDEQRTFANWCLLHALPFCWHATHKRSTANVGTFDFWVGKDGRSAWLEFKQLPVRLSSEQLAFGDALSAQGLEWHIVHSAAEAIELIKGWQVSIHSIPPMA